MFIGSDSFGNELIFQLDFIMRFLERSFRLMSYDEQ